MPGRHRHLHRTGFVVTAAALSVAVIAGGAWAGYQRLQDDECATTVDLRVDAAPEIAPAVQAAATTWSKQDGACARVTVEPVDPAAVAAAVGGRHGVNLEGVGSGAKAQTGGVDVWIPDSSTWLLRITSEAPGFLPSVLGPVANSPVVLAAPEPSAEAFGWPARTPKMSDLAKKMAVDKSLRPGIVEPARDATGLSGLLTLGSAAGAGASAAALRVGVLRALSANSSSIRTDMLTKLGDSVGLAPLSEADVIAYNAKSPTTRLAALYPDPATAALDYPYAVMPGIAPEKVTAAAELRAAPRAGDFTGELAKAGLRAPDGSTGAGFPAPKSAPAKAAPPPGGKDPKAVAGAIAQLLGSWTAITQPGRMLAVFDVSGSMKAKVPTAGGLTRAQVTQGVARQGLALLDGRWSVGNWTFSTNMAGKRPWVENMPISSCATNMPELKAAINKIVPVDGGDTGLFDTALAAYERVQKGWQPGVSEAIVKAAGSGGVFVATDPAKIGEIFLEAIASRRGA